MHLPRKRTAKRKASSERKRKIKKTTQIEELTDRVQRQMAEFDNFRKRTEKEKAAMFEVGAKSVIEKLLPTVDNFERGFASVTDEQKEDPFVQGMEKVYRQLMAALESIGVKPIEAVGQEFNPNFHNAVMHVEDEEAGENIVAGGIPERISLPRYRCKTQYGKSSKLRLTDQNLMTGGNDYEQDYWY